jgi:dTDP-D-glucose 4,6-dehydratase
MPSEANDTPTTLPIALLRAADALGDLGAGIDALMYFSVSGHLDRSAQSALGFIHRNLSDLLEDARERVDHARSLESAG